MYMFMIDIFSTIVNAFQPFIINSKRFILDFASVLDPSPNTIKRF